MAIRDCSGLPDDKVPAWVRRSREAKRAADAAYRKGKEEEKMGKIKAVESLAMDKEEAIIRAYESGEVDYDETFDKLRKFGREPDDIAEMLEAVDSSR